MMQIYSRSACDARYAAKAFLTEQGIPFDQRDIRKDSENLRTWVEELHSRTTTARGAGAEILAGLWRCGVRNSGQKWAFLSGWNRIRLEGSPASFWNCARGERCGKQ